MLHVPDTAKYLWNKIVDANESGETYYPVWGTCLGLVWMVSMVSEKGGDILTDHSARNVTLPLKFTDYGRVQSRIYMDDWAKTILMNEKVAFHNHKRGVSVEDFLNDKNLSRIFAISTYNFDEKDFQQKRPFVSTIEAYGPEKYPYFAVQWHPEKNNFEYGLQRGNGTDTPYEQINHSPNAAYISQTLANMFIFKTRLNKHVYKDVEKYPYIWTYKMEVGDEFEQKFIIPSPSKLTHNNIDDSTNVTEEPTFQNGEYVDISRKQNNLRIHKK